jgi:transposase
MHGLFTNVFLLAGLAFGVQAAEPVLVPQIDGNFWNIAGDPDLGKYTTTKHQPVDFGIDAQARTDNLDHATRHALRLERAIPLLDTIKQQIEAARAGALPASALGKAASYTLALWGKLTRSLEHPELELSTNLAENSMRPLVPGRKNWIHTGSQQAGPRVAAILSIVESCRRLKIPIRHYLTAVLPGLADFSIPRLAELTPTAWSAGKR